MQVMSSLISVVNAFDGHAVHERKREQYLTIPKTHGTPEQQPGLVSFV
tara:strand:+ start:170 stop:313 length:144 start_codon:yes stop_codon:yes gene_type:complete